MRSARRENMTISTCKNDWETGIATPYFLGEIKPAEARNDDVREHDIKSALVFVQFLKCLSRIAYEHTVETKLAKSLGCARQSPSTSLGTNG